MAGKPYGASLSFSTPDRIELRGPYWASSLVSAVYIQVRFAVIHLTASARTSGRIRTSRVKNDPEAKAPGSFSVRPTGFEPVTSASGGLT